MFFTNERRGSVAPVASPPSSHAPPDLRPRRRGGRRVRRPANRPRLVVVVLRHRRRRRREGAPRPRRAGRRGRGLALDPPGELDALVRLLLAAGLVFGLYAQLQLGARLQSDGFYYFAYLQSLAFDRDVDFTNDYKLLGLGDKTHLSRPRRPATRSPRGRSARRSPGRRSTPAAISSPARCRQAAPTCRSTARRFRTASRSASPASCTGCSAGGSAIASTTVWFTPGRAAAAVAVMALGSFMLVHRQGAVDDSP